MIEAITRSLREHREDLRPGPGPEYLCSCGWTRSFNDDKPDPPAATQAHLEHRAEAILAALIGVS
jgi:hypothetical protein